jgi:hypothetical protein
MAVAQPREEEEEESRRRGRRSPRTRWVRPWLRRRQQFGWCENLKVELENEDPRKFKNMLRMEPAMFHELEARLTPRLLKRDSNLRRAFTPGLKLAITLKYLATGINFKTLMQGFRVSSNNIGLIVREVCGAIAEEYRDEVINCPKTEEEWKEVAGNFATRWNFCHAHGAFIGNMSGLRSHPNPAQPTTTTRDFSPSSSWPWWILTTNSCGLKLVLTVHAQIFNSSQLKQKILNGTLNIPQPEPLPGDDQPMPYFLICDDACALRQWMMKPYCRRNMDHVQRVYNYRCSRARRVVEMPSGSW